MTTSVDEVARQAMSLPPHEREELLETLLRSLSGGVDPAIDEAWRTEINRRVRQIQTGAVTALSRQEADALLDRRRQARMA